MGMRWGLARWGGAGQMGGLARWGGVEKWGRDGVRGVWLNGVGVGWMGQWTAI